MADQIQLRGGTAAAWTSANPVLAAREIGVETDTLKLKVGDGTTAWSSLSYFGYSSLEDIADVTLTGIAAGEMLKWNGTAWINRTVGELGLSVDGHEHAGEDITSGTVPIARLPEGTSADYRGNTADKLLSADQVWSAMAEVSLSDGASIALDLGSGFDFTVTLGGNRTLANATNVKAGQRGRIRVVQDGTGSRTLAYGTNYEFAEATAPVLSTAASSQDILFYDCISATRILISPMLLVS